MAGRAGLGILIKELVFGRSSLKFLVGVVISFAFSIAVILCTVGIMDGFDSTLKKGLKRASGDILVYSHDGFFRVDEVQNVFNDIGIVHYAPILQTEGFLIHQETSKGVVVKGIDSQEFFSVSGIDISLKENKVAIGRELAGQLHLSIGDEVVIALSSGKSGFSNLPFLRRVKVGDIVSHGIYDKDLRFIYIDRAFLQDSLLNTDRVNIVSLNVPSSYGAGVDEVDRIENFSQHVLEKLERIKETTFIVRPYWQEFGGLIEAVKIEKFSIGLILQLVVIMAIFNVIAFFIYINERKAQHIFLFRALGVRQKEFLLCWFGTIMILWFLSCLGSICLAEIFDWGLVNFSFLKIPGDVYVLNQLKLQLDFADYFWVFLLALLWMAFIAGFSVWRIMRRSVLQGLRKEFS